jgi:hypothetical protein
LLHVLTAYLHLFLQHDCQEFLALLLDSLHEYLNQQSVLKPNNSCVNNELSPLSGCQESEQPDFGTLYLDSDHSVPVGELIHSGSASRENQDDPVGAEQGGNFDFSELAKKQFEDQAFSTVVSSASEAISSSDGRTDIKDNVGTSPEECKEVLMELGDETFQRKIPSIDDFCSKDTKTLNTNVLVPTDDASDLLATDSTKFHKQDNTSIIADEDDVEDDTTPGVIDSGQLHDLFMAACASKPVKETNLIANCHEKFSDSQKISVSNLSSQGIIVSRMLNV